MRSKNSKKKMPDKKRKRRSPSLLYICIALLSLWLSGCLILAFFYVTNNENATMELKELASSPSDENDEGNIFFELLDLSDGTTGTSSADTEWGTFQEQRTRDEFQPTRESLFKERKLTRENVKSLFESYTSTKKLDTGHSTFGKEVVYIYHSHSREAFLPYFKNTEKPEEAFHPKANITLVGQMLGKALERRGIGSAINSNDMVKELDERKLDYGSSYTISGEQVRAAQKENSQLEIFLDIHRDSLRYDSTTSNVKGEKYAQLLFVIGTGHRNFERNLSFTEGLNQQLEANYPGLSKGILKKSSNEGNGVYNQDLSPNSVIVEIGGVDNTAEELQRTVEALADVLSDYYWHGKEK